MARELLKGAFSVTINTTEISREQKSELTMLVKYVCLLHEHEEKTDDLDLLMAARAASLCDLPEAALLLLSIWWDVLNAEEGRSAPVAFHDYNGSTNLLLVQVDELF